MKSKLPIIAAIILAFVAVTAIRSYVKRVEADAAQQLKGRQIVFASKEIPKGAELAENMMTMDSVPDKFIPRQAITSLSEKRQIVGRTTRVRIPKGKLILWSDIEVEKQGGLSSLVPEGERAFAIDIDLGVNTDLLQLNDRVDVIGIFQETQDTGLQVGQIQAAGVENPVCVVLLQSVNVIAIGTTIGETYGLSSQEISGGGNVTFSVTLPEAQLLLYASSHGELALVLRREGEIEVLAREDLPRVTMKNLDDIINDLDSKRNKRVIQVMKGGRAEEVEVEIEGGTDLQTFE